MKQRTRQAAFVTALLLASTATATLAPLLGGAACAARFAPDTSAPTATFGRTTPFLPNVGFESVVGDAPGATAADWSAFGQGYTLDSAVRHGGARSIRCDSTGPGESHGASFTIELNQKEPRPIEVTGWSRAQGVGGLSDADYSIYFDIEYADGSVLWAHTANFSVGTHDWEKKRLLVCAPKPIKKLTVYALFRGHAGTVWFDDFEGRTIDEPFDSQAVAPPEVAPGAAGGWFVRDVAAGGGPVPLREGSAALGVCLAGVKRENGSRVLSARLANETDRSRAVTLYYVERFDAERPVWWDDIHRSRAIPRGSEGTNLVQVRGGAVGAMSLYPWGCVTADRSGRALGVPPGIGPRIDRIGYHAGSGLLYAAFDLTLPAKSAASRFAPVTAAVARYDVDPAWGFRDAARQLYALFPTTFTRRAKKEGIWVAFTDPAHIKNVADFHIAYHEGDNSVKSDDALGILSFRYKEPMSYVQSLPKSVPRTYVAVLKTIQADLTGTNEEKRRWAEAVLRSCSKAPDGSYNVRFEAAPWSDGAVWTMNPNPALPRRPDEWTKARLNLSEQEMVSYTPAGRKNGVLDGEFLDSLEANADVLDFRPESMEHTRLPLTFTTDSFEPTLPTWFSVWEYSHWLSGWLHARGGLLFANTALTRYQALGTPLDVAGIETVWGTSEKFRPDPDAVLSFRRTMSYHKPYILLQNNDYDKFGRDAVEKYMRRSLFYGIYPSFFSVNAADKPYWENAKWYDRDRALFQKYIPIAQCLSAAGWEPVTWAKSDRAQVYVERFGTEYLTVLNDSGTAANVVVTLDPELLRGRTPLTVTEEFSGRKIDAASPMERRVTIPLTLEPGDSCVLHLGRKGR